MNTVQPVKALVTGAAARIGAAIAQTLHRRGCEVLLHYNSNQQQAQALADQLNGQRPASAAIAQADLSRDDGPMQLAEAVRQHWGSLDLLVNNASRFFPTAVGDTLAWQWADLLNSNLRGPYFLVQSLLGELRTAGGSIVNIVDIHAERPMRGHAVYSISKAGIAMMTRALAAELGPEVRVNGVAPGAILWPASEPSAEEKTAILDKTLLKKRGQADDIASAVAYLALDAHYVTGQILAVDGGRSVNM